MRRMIALSAMGAAALVGTNARAGTNLIVNGNFATPGSVNDFVSMPGGATWTYSIGTHALDDVGVASDSPSPSVVTYPYSTTPASDHLAIGQVGYLQNTASLIQTFTAPASGTYTVSFDAADSTDTVDNLVGDVLASIKTTSGQTLVGQLNGTSGTGNLTTSWQAFSFNVTLAKNVSYDLDLAQTAFISNTVTHVALVDNASIVASAPEPGSTILAIGSGLGLILRRRRR